MNSTSAAALQITEWPKQHQRLAVVDRFVDALVNALGRDDSIVMVDKVEVLQNGHVGGDPAFEDPTNTVCTSCHGDRSGSLARRGCTDKWKNHLIQGRASEVAWEYMSTTYAGSTCGW